MRTGLTERKREREREGKKSKKQLCESTNLKAAAMPVDIAAVVKDWLDEPPVVQRAAVYKLMSYELGISPDAAESHSIILAPMMKHVGLPNAFMSTCFCFIYYVHVPCTYAPLNVCCWRWI